MDSLQSILNLDMLRTLLLAFPAFCTIRCILFRGKEHVIKNGTYSVAALKTNISLYNEKFVGIVTPVLHGIQ